MNLLEACAEKVRATLTRKDPAPRDLYDLDQAVNSGVLEWRDDGFLQLVARKISNEPPADWLEAGRMEAFRRGLEMELRPVLRPDAYAAFDFNRAVATLSSMAQALKTLTPSE